MLTEENITIMKNHGIILFIDRPLDQILSDIKMDRRPTLRGGTHEDVIEQYNARIGYYRYAADFHFDNSHGFQPGVTGLIDLVSAVLSLPGRPWALPSASPADAASSSWRAVTTLSWRT